MKRSQRPWSWRRRVAVAAVTFGGLAIGSVVATNVVIVRAGGARQVTLGSAPHAQAALVLGALVHPDGTLSGMLDDRVATGVALYKAGKVDKLLLSGDHHRVDYDEVNAMKAAAMRAGVPENDIFCDHAGLNTWDSMVRARQVFAVSTVLVVTQRFHLARATWLAIQAGLDAHGVVADLRPYGMKGRQASLREIPARVKSFVEAATGRSPRFLGPVIPITGDGLATTG